MESSFALEFEWDDNKAAANLAKHHVGFSEAATVFDDPLALTYPDLDHSNVEDRFITIGMSDSQRLLVLSHTARSGHIRIISARKSTRAEGKHYEEG